MNLATRILYMRKYPFLKKLSYYLLKLIGVEIPLSVKIGKNVELVHWAYGTVIHPNVIIEDNVKIYPGVTIGRSDVANKFPKEIKIVIKKNAILCTGAKILTKDELIVEEGTIVGANCVLLKSTEKKSIYVGIPAKRIDNK